MLSGAACAQLVPLAATISGSGISKGYVLPSAKAGIDQQQYLLSVPASTWGARYDATSGFLHPQISKANVFWRTVEKFQVGQCTKPQGFIWPPNATEMARTGAHTQHCYDTVVVKSLDQLFGLDLAHGIQSAVVLWSSPEFYIDPGCLGSTRLGTQGCPPVLGMPAWDDFIAFLTDRYPSITHFIAWNEVDDSDWFDPSPQVNNTQRHVGGTSDGDRWVALYARLLTGAHAAIARNQRAPKMLYAATDRQLTSSPWCGDGTRRWGSRCPLGTWNLLEGLWRQIGNSIDWSVVVHAYGDPTGSDYRLVQPYQAYTFRDLPHVAEFQRNMSIKYTGSYDTYAPQQILAASEQGWATANSSTVARNLCVAHDIANWDHTVAWHTMYYFQETNGNYYGIIPHAAGADLNGSGGPTLAAYRALAPNVWGKDASNYCCQTMRLGCPSLFEAVSLA